MWSFSEIHLFLSRARRAEATLHPSFKAFNMGDLVKISSHLVCVPSLDQQLLATANGLEHLLVILFLPDDRLLVAEVLPLVSNLLLEDVVLSEASQFLLEHELVVLISHELLNLGLTLLQFQHDLSVTGFNRLIVVTLAILTEVKRLLASVLCIVVEAFLLVIVLPHRCCSDLGLFLGPFDFVRHERVFLCTEH